jgi:hypothetical protein
VTRGAKLPLRPQGEAVRSSRPSAGHDGGRTSKFGADVCGIDHTAVDHSPLRALERRVPLMTDHDRSIALAATVRRRRRAQTSLQVSAVVVVWNELACGIEFAVGDTLVRCGVWANAVAPT